MQTLSIYQNTDEGLKAATSELGPEAAQLARLKADYEREQRSVLLSMQDNAVRHKEQGNLAMGRSAFRGAVREYNQALEHAHHMMAYLDVGGQRSYNGYQLRAIAQGRELPRQGPEALNPFRAVVRANRSLAFLRLDAYNRALEDATEACRLEPRFLKAWIRRAAALAASNRREEALDALGEALKHACPSEAMKEQVCKLIVNVRGLGNVEVRPPEKDLPVVYADVGKPKKKKPTKEKIQVPIGMLRSPKEAREGTAADESDGSETRQVVVEVDKRDLDVFLQEDWHATHLGGRWRQSLDELAIVVELPRRPKACELLVQIRLRQVWVLLRRVGCSGGRGRDDYDTVADAALAGPVRPSESTWTLGPGDTRELYLALQKQEAAAAADQADGKVFDVLPRLWARAFELDEPIDVHELAEAKAARAGERRRQTSELLAQLASQARAARGGSEAGGEGDGADDGAAARARRGPGAAERRGRLVDTVLDLG